MTCYFCRAPDQIRNDYCDHCHEPTSGWYVYRMNARVRVVRDAAGVPIAVRPQYWWLRLYFLTRAVLSLFARD
jgi:hypothetical protein